MVQWIQEVNPEWRPWVYLNKGATSIGQQAVVLCRTQKQRWRGRTGEGEVKERGIRFSREGGHSVKVRQQEQKAWWPSLCKGLNEAAGFALMGHASLHHFWFFDTCEWSGVNNILNTAHPFWFTMLYCSPFDWFMLSEIMTSRRWVKSKV